MKNLALKIEEVSKMYDLGQVGTGTISKDLNRSWAKLRGKPDPYATLAEINDRTTKSSSGVVWALKDINLEVEQGEVLGIIGRNGAGKSTLLKILSKITSPTTGFIKTKGRMASLLEVGTGMHPEMTARENIFLNGAIMGMTRREIRQKLDDIVDFAGIEKYIDTPIKRFSSGMQVRLGFAVAAFLEPEILIVDEVLAVGDAEFQKRAVGKMKEVSQGGDRTVLFVSHNMASIENLCEKCLVIEKGEIFFNGDTREAIKKYLSNDQNKYDKISSDIPRRGNGQVRIETIKVFGEKPDLYPQTGHPFHITFHLKEKEGVDLSQLLIDLRIDDEMGQKLIWMSNRILENKKGAKTITFYIDRLNLNEGTYNITTYLELNNDVTDWIQNVYSFDVQKGDYYRSGRVTSPSQSKVLIDYQIKYDI